MMERAKRLKASGPEKRVAKKRSKKAAKKSTQKRTKKAAKPVSVVSTEAQTPWIDEVRNIVNGLTAKLENEKLERAELEKRMIELEMNGGGQEIVDQIICLDKQITLERVMNQPAIVGSMAPSYRSPKTRAMRQTIVTATINLIKEYLLRGNDEEMCLGSEEAVQSP